MHAFDLIQCIYLFLSLAAFKSNAKISKQKNHASVLSYAFILSNQIKTFFQVLYTKDLQFDWYDSLDLKYIYVCV